MHNTAQFETYRFYYYGSIIQIRDLKDNTTSKGDTPEHTASPEEPQSKVISLADVRFRISQQTSFRPNPASAPRLDSDLAKKIRIPVQQLQYRSYKYDIPLYHYSAYIMPVRLLLNTFRRASHGYHHTYLGLDPLHNLKTPKGDDPPPGRIEVAYLRNVFQGKGSAIGFRDKQNNRIEWLCFVEPSECLIEEARGPRGEKLFELVGEMPKDGKGEQGNKEHREWFESVTWGVRKSERLVLTWRNKDKDRMEAIERGEQITKKRANNFVRVRTGERPAVEYKVKALKSAVARESSYSNMKMKNALWKDGEDEEMAEDSPEPQVPKELTTDFEDGLCLQLSPQSQTWTRSNAAAHSLLASSRTLSPCPRRN
ncbi:hypothetical protein K491DRAFT_781601 [Lophiostoma macrostomum CBS 122681]|uniref:Uncharacterized protein n=1 Tax=Lophiostoma macrostomum CBS 122681 TaxID=1314788 RepID=A0A6A6SW19_9PLEO|nr:hypothetical protein K491DRAFT_781601 [Lophiostoma macrostomum CBS 122681]